MKSRAPVGDSYPHLSELSDENVIFLLRSGDHDDPRATITADELTIAHQEMMYGAGRHDPEVKER